MKKVLGVIILSFFFCHSFSKVYYVRVNATGLNNGTSWLNAYTWLDSALVYAISGDTIKVSKGVYVPQLYQDPNRSFHISQAVIMWGGYPDTGSPTNAERNFSDNKTTLSGEIGNSDNTDNLKTIIESSAQGGEINGFVIEAAIGDYVETFPAEACLYLRDNCKLSFTNCIFDNNRTVISCWGSMPQFNNCIFQKNNNTQNGASIDANASSNITFNNCIFFNNKRSTDDAKTFYSDNSTINIINSDLVSTEIYAGHSIEVTNNSVLNCSNSIFWIRRSAFTSDSEISFSNSSVNVTKCMSSLSNNITGFIYIGMQPKFNNVSNPAGLDNKYFTADDGLQLSSPCSPALNSGLNSIVSNIPKDMLGNSRIFNTGIVDLGPYENQGAVQTPIKTVFVNKIASGNNDGGSWTNAFINLQNALMYCADTIKIAEGSYTLGVNDPDSSFILENNKTVLGGYPNTGNPTDAQRNPTLHPSILDGLLKDGSGVVLVTLLSSHASNQTLIDGLTFTSTHVGTFLRDTSNLTIRNCTYENNSSEPYLAGIINIQNNSNPTISNCVFQNNLGNAIWIEGNSSPKILKCTFTANMPGIKGSCVTARYSSPSLDSCIFSNNTSCINNYNSTGTFTNCEFFGNTAPDAGADIYNDSGTYKFSNCYFHDNDHSFYIPTGGSMYNNNCSLDFENCIFQHCQASYGGAIYNSSCEAKFLKCAFINNLAQYNGGGILNSGGSTSLVNCLSIGNISSAGTFVHNTNSPCAITNTTMFFIYAFIDLTPIGSSTGGIIASNAGLAVNNCIFWADKTTYKGYLGDNSPTDIVASSPDSVKVHNSITQFYGTTGENGNLVGVNPCLVNISDFDGPDNKYFTSDDGLNLLPCSQAINKGDNTYITGYPIDIANNPRLFNNGIVDMGAYEYQSNSPTQPKTVYVNALAAGNNTGSSWQNAFTNLQNALNGILR